MKRVTDQQYILVVSAAIQQVDNIVSLLEENEWKDFMYQTCHPSGMNLNVNYPIWRTTDETGKLLSNHTLHKYNRLSRLNIRTSDILFVTTSGKFLYWTNSDACLVYYTCHYCCHQMSEETMLAEENNQ